ncbi:hypothetical protein HMPREF9588_00502 [Cutibacterium acnes HL025PA2]|nr:hypothetical protein HMPREF9588_00502 [Cutibacterium acnes HL025PA2]
MDAALRTRFLASMCDSSKEEVQGQINWRCHGDSDPRLQIAK